MIQNKLRKWAFIPFLPNHCKWPNKEFYAFPQKDWVVPLLRLTMVLSLSLYGFKMAGQQLAYSSCAGKIIAHHPHLEKAWEPQMQREALFLAAFCSSRNSCKWYQSQCKPGQHFLFKLNLLFHNFTWERVVVMEILPRQINSGITKKTNREEELMTLYHVIQGAEGPWRGHNPGGGRRG